MLWFSAKGKPQNVVEDYYADATQKEWLQRSHNDKCLDFYFLCSHCYSNTCIQLKKKGTWHLRQLKWKTLIFGLSKNTRREIDNDKANR